MRFAKSAALALALLFVAAAPVLAQTGGTAATAPGAGGPVYYPFSELRSLAIGLIIIGAAVGIGGLGRSAVESMSRQPEVAGNIQTAMIIAAALIEGVTFFALIIVAFIITGHPA